MENFICPNYLDYMPLDEIPLAESLVNRALAAGFYAIGICEGYIKEYNQDGQFDDEKGQFDYVVGKIGVDDIVGVNPSTRQMEFLLYYKDHKFDNEV